MSETSASTPLPAHSFAGHATLTHLGVIRASGPDAASFLQGQLTQDVVLLGLDTARLAAYCNPKGRMQASFIVVKTGAEELLLVCEQSVLAAVLKRLSMFVLRARCKLTDASGEFRLLGLAGPLPLLSDAAWTRADEAGAIVVSLLPALGQGLGLQIAAHDAPLPRSPAIDAAHWQWLLVRSGLALVGQPCFEAFVPQMLNYESIGGVSFKKGCYPGQEVVARSQFRGTLKRRAHLLHAPGPLAVGQALFHTQDPEQPCGLVAAAAPRPDGHGWDALASLQLASIEAAPDGLRAGSAAGLPLALLPLPYPLLADV